MARIWSAYSVDRCGQLTSVCRRTPELQSYATHLFFFFPFKLLFKFPIFHFKVFYFSLAFQLSLCIYPLNVKNNLREAGVTAELGKWHQCTTGVRN